MHAKLVVSLYAKLLQTVGLQKLSEFADQQRFILLIWFGLVWKTFAEKFKAIQTIFGHSFYKVLLQPSGGTFESDIHLIPRVQKTPS